MDRTASASHLLDPLVPQWQELLQRWALDGSISRSELADRLVARPFDPFHTNCWSVGSARHSCSSDWAADRGYGLSEP